MDKNAKKRKAFKHSKGLTLLVFAATALAIILIYLSRIGIISEWVAAIIALVVSGELIAIINGLNSTFGIYMFGGHYGISTIEKLSEKNVKYWRAFAEWGLVVSLGLFSLFFRKHIGKGAFIVGFASLFIFIFVIMPILPLTLSFINIPQLSNQIATEAVSTNTSQVNYAGYLIDGASIGGGFATFVMVALVYNAAHILMGISSFLSTPITQKSSCSSALAAQVPGVAPLIPGLTISLYAGIIALVVILIIHEFSHGVLARIAKVKIKKVGLVIFGIIPLGAFVEPDEKKVEKLSKDKQNRIFIAGVSANFLAAIVFAVLTFILYLAAPYFTQQQVVVAGTAPCYPAYNVLPIGAKIISWNNYPIKNLSSFVVAAKTDTAFSTVNVVTNTGSYTFKTNQTGKIGVYLESANETKQGMLAASMNFMYSVFALLFLLNFSIAIVNLLPVPGFDGWRVYKTKANSKILNVLVAIVVISLLVNVLPWIWIG